MPPAAWRAAAREAPADAHARLMAAPEAGALHLVRMARAETRLPPPASATVAAWNVERGRDTADIARILAAVGADIALLTELDVGMARSGNRDTADEIARRLGMHSAFAVEFIELGLGDARETAECAGQENAAGLHGNAVLSRHPILRAVVIPLDDGGFWFAGAGDPAQRRIGGRNAVAALMDFAAGPVWCVAVHLESHGTPATRGHEMARLLAALNVLDPPAPVLVGGDLNTKTVDAAVLSGGIDAQALAPEPLFAVAARNGFTWEGANVPVPTTRRRAWQAEPPPARKLDWFLSRGLRVGAPAVHPAVDAAGRAISDHELLTVAIEPEPLA